MRSALVWSVVWTAIGTAFAALVLAFGSGAQAGEYLAGFLIEKSLSLDNLFVFAVLFSFFAVPDSLRQRVLVLGIAGAIVLRVLFIVLGAAALDAVHAVT
ncbi:MAG: tellurite resistance protein TerC, partial [Solirubrobacteraceae bacterium]|nr:tellurite resistance protein TerC [Solirubrobacteraceae bacterium]